MFSRSASTFARSARTAFTAGAARTISTSAASQSASLSRAAVVAGAATAAGASLYMLSGRQQPLHLDGPRTIAGEYKTTSEKTFIMIKPDGVSRQLVGKIISTFETRGYKLVALKSLVPSKALAEKHYSDLSARPFFPSLVKYITQGVPVVAMVWEGKDAIRQGRRIVGATNPLEADPGSIRGQYAVSIGRNIIHASDSFDSATNEIGLWFDPKELAEYQTAAWDQIFADN
ncbi:nucleoside diphosphate kinase Ndk1 [Tilletia horrida]|uniref:Nucleoside diphosphate kinase n=1 Tax=Tilletia horrida TaxID=155126 RepID=A0AAN6GQ91_9BASI|nr:nucleoside diphosphate kinase Ndk1 [Tilletia horrida]KAK0567226.1 nucleoside diphosphate kinase Ndk1 [Tilletia horrida]